MFQDPITGNDIWVYPFKNKLKKRAGSFSVLLFMVNLVHLNSSVSTNINSDKVLWTSGSFLRRSGAASQAHNKAISPVTYFNLHGDLRRSF